MIDWLSRSSIQLLLVIIDDDDDEDDDDDDEEETLEKNYPTTMRDEETWSPKGETTRKIRAET